jgi:hypothetical protein
MSKRNHAAKYEQFECGENARHCRWLPIAAAAIGAAGSFLSAKQQAKAQEAAGNATSSQRTWSQATPHPAVQPLLGMLSGGTQAMGQVPTPFFPGPTYVAPSQPTQMGVNAAMRAAQTGMQSYLNRAQQNYGFLSGAANIADNPYVQAINQMTQRNLTQNLRENILPQVNQGALQVNALGSGRHGLMQGRAIGDTQRAIADAQTQTNLGAYGQGLGAQQGALGATGAMLQNQLAPAQAMMVAGQQVEGYQGRALQDAMARFQHQYGEPWQRLGWVQGAMSPFQSYATTQGFGNTAQQGAGLSSVSPFASALSGGLQGYGVGRYMAGQRQGPPAPILSGGGTLTSSATATGGAPVYTY